MFSLELPHRGDSKEYAKHNIIQYRKENHPNYSKYNHECLQLWDFFLGIQERVRNSRGKRAIGVRAIEVLLYLKKISDTYINY